MTDRATDTAIHQALRESVVDVLEKMFFIEAIAEPFSNTPAEGTSVLVQLDFDGDPPGIFRMSLPRAAAARIAADFLGADAESLTGPQVCDVVKELANMICGAVLSRIESRATFRLAAPGLVQCVTAVRGAILGTVCAVETGSGILTAGIEMETRTCSPTEKSAS